LVQHKRQKNFWGQFIFLDQFGSNVEQCCLDARIN
jgi:hypothetical protein